MALALVAVFMVFVDGTIVNLTLAQLGSHLHASRPQLQWTIDAYTLSFAAVMLGAGAISPSRHGSAAQVPVQGVATSYGRATACYIDLVATVIPQRELRNRNADILNRVEAGESFVVTRNGTAVADVTPHARHGEPPMFPRTMDLVARRQASNQLAPDVTAWLRDIRDDGAIDDDPLNSRV